MSIATDPFPLRQIVAGEGASGFRRVAVAIDDAGHMSEALALAALAVDPKAGRVRLIQVRPRQVPPVPSREDGSFFVLGTELFSETSEHATWGAELVVIGRNPRRRFGSPFWRRISDQVMQEAPCPVVIARSTST